MSSSNPIMESDKRRLTEYFAERLRTRLSGRDQADLVDATPIRTLFAGVLQPVRVIQSVQANDKPSGTAIGLDFRVAPDGTGPLSIAIQAGWSHYYCVFPSWADATRANSEAPSGIAVVPRQTASAAGEIRETSEALPVEDASRAGDEGDEETSDDEVPITRSGSAILPRAWRRKDVTARPVDVILPIGADWDDAVGAPEIVDALNAATGEMAGDGDRWRHLGDPDKRERALGPVQVVRDEDTYRSALRGVAGEPAPLPAWSAALRVESRRESDGRAIRVRILLANATTAFDESVKDTGLQERALFDAHLKVTIRGGTLVPFDFLLAPKDYKSNPQMPAKGVNCVAVVRPDAPATVATETLPVFAQPLYRTRDVLSIPFNTLDVSDPIPMLLRVAVAMDEYIAQWDVFLRDEAPAALSPTGLCA